MAKQAYGTAYQTVLPQTGNADMAAAYANQTAEQLGGLQKTFSAKYDITAFIPAIGLSYSF